MDPALILGPYGAIVLLMYAVIHLYRENTALRDDAMTMLKNYQERDEEERKLRLVEDRRRTEERWHVEERHRMERGQ